MGAHTTSQSWTTHEFGGTTVLVDARGRLVGSIGLGEGWAYESISLQHATITPLLEKVSHPRETSLQMPLNDHGGRMESKTGEVDRGLSCWLQDKAHW